MPVTQLTSPDTVAASWALMALACEDQYDIQGEDCIEPALDPRLTGWQLRGYLTALDSLDGLDAHRRFYGWLLWHAGEFAIVCRGTDGWQEWLDDAAFAPRKAHPVAGEVETGFFDLYSTMKFRFPGGKDLPLATSIASIVGSGPLTCVAHSLGSAMMSYAAFDLASVCRGTISAKLFASPHPGDAVFSEAFGKRVPDHVMYRNVRDAVPDVPASLGYCSVPNVLELTPGNGVQVADGLGPNHHITTYAALLLRGPIPPSDLLPFDNQYTSCLTFP